MNSTAFLMVSMVLWISEYYGADMTFCPKNQKRGTLPMPQICSLANSYSARLPRNFFGRCCPYFRHMGCRQTAREPSHAPSRILPGYSMEKLHKHPVIIHHMENRVIFILFHSDHRSTLFRGLPLASSSTSLSSQRIFCIMGSSIVSTCTPHTFPLISSALGFIAGA